MPRRAYYKPVLQDFPSPPTCLDLPRLAYYKPVLQDFPSPPTCLPHFRHRKLTPTTTTAAKEKRASREWDPLAGASCALSSQRVTRGSGNLAGHPSRSHPTLPQVWLLIQKRGLGIPLPRTSRVAAYYARLASDPLGLLLRRWLLEGVPPKRGSLGLIP